MDNIKNLIKDIEELNKAFVTQSDRYKEEVVNSDLPKSEKDRLLKLADLQKDHIANKDISGIFEFIKANQ